MTKFKTILAAIIAIVIMTNAASSAVLTPTVADVSSENVLNLNRHAEHTVDGSGLTGNGSAGSYHQQGENAITWTTFGIYETTDYDPYITYDLGEDFDVATMRIWNYNSNLITNGSPISIIGSYQVNVYTSVNGVDFTFAETVHFTQATGLNNYTGQDIAVDYRSIRYIKFDIMTNHDGAIFNGTGSNGGAVDGRSLTGLSEVRFEGRTPVRASNPNPNNGQGMVRANMILSWDASDPPPDGYNLYLDTDQDKVISGIDCQYTSFNQPETTFDPIADLAYDTTYCWRVDLVTSGSGVITGDMWNFSTQPQPLAGDLNGDWKVDFIDLSILATQWLNPAGCAGHPNDCADIIGTDGVNLRDLASLADNWFEGTVPAVVISEFMASNSTDPGDPDGLLDQDGDSSDWLEIHNLSDIPVSLNGWYLTDDPDELTKWQFPDIAIDDYLLLFASGKDRTDPEDQLHTSFSLSANGEYLALVRPDGQTIASEYAPEFPEQMSDISYGIYNEQLLYFGIPTPGAENTGTGLIIADPEFSQSRGFYEIPFDLSLSCDTTGATIRYTLNGSVPTESSAVYSSPINIANTKCVRAVAFKNGYIQSPPQTHTFIFPTDVITQSTLDSPIMNDPIWGVGLEDALLELPSVSLTTPHFTEIESGDGIEKETSIELIFPDGSKGFQVNAGMERFGGHSLTQDKASLRISFKKDYGPGKLNFDLFGQCEYGGQNAVTEFDQILLRSGAHDAMFWVQPDSGAKGSFLRNRWIMDRQLEMRQPAPRGRFVHVYVNGLYWGQYHLLERPNASFMASYLGDEKEDYDAVKGNSGTLSIIDGDVTAWNQMLAATNNYENLQQYMDIVNYADYMLLNFYAGNDWDWNIYQNWMAARKRLPGEGYKFFCWDSDTALRWHPNANLVNHGSLGGPGNMWFAVKQHQEVRMIMADRAHKYFFNNGLVSSIRSCSINLTNPSPTVSIISISSLYNSDVKENKSLFKVPWVASTPIFPDFDFKAADLVAGSIPIKGTS